MKAAIPILALLTACGEQSVDLPANETAIAATDQASRSMVEALAPAKAFAVEEETELYGFKYGWSAEAAGVPQLVERLTKDLEQVKAELIEGAKKDRDERVRRGFDFHPHETQRSYETAGQSDRLLSLERSAYGFTGGAHGSSGSGSLLWDMKLSREISIPDVLLPETSWTGAIRQPFCVLLDREREKRRGEPVKRDDLFGNCPGYNELTVLLRDSDKNARFDHIDVIADQYVAGPDAEGPYEISLPITAGMIERLKPEFRASFEPRPPVKSL